jgi:type III pantothenate kinase
VNARAAYELYGGECVIADFGTAITIDIVNKNKEYIGGVIAPGPGISLWALSEKTALLPKVSITKPKGILGRETRQSMLIGVVYGFSGLCDSVVRKLKKRYCKNAKVIATGGFSSLLGPYCETVDIIEPELTLKGLQIINQLKERHV